MTKKEFKTMYIGDLYQIDNKHYPYPDMVIHNIRKDIGMYPKSVGTNKIHISAFLFLDRNKRIYI